MKAAIYRGQRQVDICERPLPELGENDVLIQNIYSSICGMDVAVYQQGAATGHKIFVNGEFGHGTISRIVARSDKATDFTVGERVYPYPLYATGDTKRAGTIGGFSEYIRIPNARWNQSLYRVDDRISDRTACLIEPFTVGCRAARQYFGEAHSLNGLVPNVDCYIDASGAESVLDLFMETGKIGSRLVNVAVNKALRRLDLLHLTYASQSIIGSGGYLPEDVEDVQRIMSSGRWDIESIITQEFPLHRIGEALETASDTGKSLNVIINFEH